jgi:serine/threonine-protein kinase
MKFEDRFETPVPAGEGAFGKVYRLKDKKTGINYALKVMENRSVWEKECRFLSLADHPLFPKLEESGEEDGKYYILMEFLYGTPLDVVLDDRRGFGQTDAVRMALQIADGLAWLQEKDGTVLFRDLKAENLILQPNGDVRLTDLGSACFLSEVGQSKTGTPGASAPEQFDAPETTGAYSDVYAFGLLLHYLLTGENPLNGEPESLRSVDPSCSACLELLIEDCLRPVGEERIPDMLGVLQRLMDIVTATPAAYRRMEKAASKELAGRYGLEGDILYTKNVKL